MKQDINIELTHRVWFVKTMELKARCKMLSRTDKVNVISARRQLKGQKVSLIEELTILNIQLSEKLQEHNLIGEAWSYSSTICQKYNKCYQKNC